MSDLPDLPTPLGVMLARWRDDDTGFVYYDLKVDAQAPPEVVAWLDNLSADERRFIAGLLAYLIDQDGSS
jgi:hypothetical protein